MRTFVASDNEPITVKVREVLASHLLDCPTSQVVALDLAVDRAARVHPELMVLVLSPNPERALAVLREIRDKVQAYIIVVGPAHESKLILRSLREGADEFLDEVDPESELTAALVRLQAKGSGQRQPGRIIAVLAASGGSGSSTLAVNVATVLAKQHETAALVDLKLETGDLAALLDLKPNYTLADFGQNLPRMDRGMFEHLFARHSSGVHLLAAPRSFADIAHVTPNVVSQALNMARALFPYVVADLDHSFRDEQTAALRQANVILLVLRLDFTSLRNTRRTLEHLEKMAVRKDRVRLVVNRYRQPQELPASRVEEVLGLEVLHYVPDDPKTINRANNKGVPVVLERPSARVSRSIIAMAMSVNGLDKAQ